MTGCLLPRSTRVQTRKSVQTRNGEARVSKHQRVDGACDLISANYKYIYNDVVGRRRGPSSVNMPRALPMAGFLLIIMQEALSYHISVAPTCRKLKTRSSPRK